MTRDDRDLTGAWALHALTPAERAEFEEHLAGNEGDRTEATELTDTAVLLGLTAPVIDPPSALRERLLAAIENVPQLAPEAPRPDVAQSSLAQSSLAESSLAAAPVAAAPIAGSDDAADDADARTRMPQGRHQAPRNRAPISSKERRRFAATTKTLGFTRRTVTLLASSFVVLALLIVGGVALPSILAPAGDTQAISQLRSAPDARTAKTEITGGGTATVVWSDQRERSAITVADLASAPSNRVYQLWYIRDGAARSAGLFDVDSAGKAAVALDGRLRAGDTVGLTVEPKGGSTSPTTKPIVAVETA